MTIQEFIVLINHTNDVRKVSEDIQQLPKPKRILDFEVPENLNDITFGQLIELQKMSNDSDVIYTPSMVLFGIDAAKVSTVSADNVLGLGTWVASEINRINELFNSISNKPSAEEVRAGIHDLNFGEFGVVDYYAQRMGIADHEQVMNVPWLRIYMCMNMDAKKAEYTKRLREIYNKKQKA